MPDEFRTRPFLHLSFPMVANKAPVWIASEPVVREDAAPARIPGDHECGHSRKQEVRKAASRQLNTMKLEARLELPAMNKHSFGLANV